VAADEFGHIDRSLRCDQQRLGWIQEMARNITAELGEEGIVKFVTENFQKRLDFSTMLGSYGFTSNEAGFVFEILGHFERHSRSAEVPG